MIEILAALVITGLIWGFACWLHDGWKDLNEQKTMRRVQANMNEFTRSFNNE